MFPPPQGLESYQSDFPVCVCVDLVSTLPFALEQSIAASHRHQQSCTYCSIELEHMVVQSIMLACGLQHTRRAMTNVGIPADEQDAVFQLVATVLHLGNLEFTEAGEHDSSQVVESSADALEAAAKLLGVQTDGLSRALTTRTRHTVDGNLPACLCFSGLLGPNAPEKKRKAYKCSA